MSNTRRRAQVWRGDSGTWYVDEVSDLNGEIWLDPVDGLLTWKEAMARALLFVREGM